MISEKVPVPGYYRKGFDSWEAKMYDIGFTLWSLGRQRRMRRLFLDHMPRAVKSVLDMATGTGAVAIELKRNLPKAEVTGIDLSKVMLLKAKKKAGRQGMDVTFVQQNIEKTGFPPNHFDVVTISLGLHEIPEQSRLLVIKEAYRLLKKGGVFIIMDLSSPKNRFMKMLLMMHFRLLEPAYAKSILHEDLPEELRMNRFKSVKKKEYFNGLMQVLLGVK